MPQLLQRNDLFGKSSMLFFLRLLTIAVLTVLLVPLLAAVALALLLCNVTHLLGRFARPSPAADEAPLPDRASIIILNWNGKDLLAQGLPSVLEAVRTDGLPHEVLVVDNGSSDGSLEFMEAEFPEVRILRLPENLGFAEGNNAGVRAAKNGIVILLNNDMVVDPGFLRPLLDGFRPDTFAVSSQIYLQDAAARREETGKTTAAFRRGWIDFSHQSIDAKSFPRSYYPILWAGGGSSAFHRERFLKLGGFKKLYSPAYVEDTDLSYQAWKAGWEVLFAPDSIVYHKHRASSIRRFKPRELQNLILRNQMLFVWKNLEGWRFLLLHCAFLPWNCYRLARDFGLGIWMSILQAACRIPSALAAKLAVPFKSARSDKEIFMLCEKPGLFFSRSAGDRKTHSRLPAARADAPRPRVVWLTAYLPHSGRHAGAGRMYQLLKRLCRRYRITLLTFLESEQEREFLPEVEILCERVIAMRRLPPFRWKLFAYEPFEEFCTPEMHRALQSCLENYDFDLIQLEYTQMASYADTGFGIPVLLTKHEVDFAACARRARVESNFWQKLRWLYNYLQVLDREIKLTRRVDAVICMTEPDAIELQRFCSAVQIHVVNTGVDLDYFRHAGPPAARPRLVFVGAFQHLPNVDAMVYFCREVLPLIRGQVPAAELLIVGSNPPPAVMSLGRMPGVEVTGFVPDIRTCMSGASVYVVPLRLGVGIRGKILEAWSMQMAVVATSVACAGLRYENGRNLLVADTNELFASHVVSLLNDPLRREQLGREGRKLVERSYAWEASAQKLDDIYQRYLFPDIRQSRRAAKK